MRAARAALLLKYRSPSVKHQDIAGSIFVKMKLFVDGKGLGKVFYELDVHIDDENIVRPDVIYVKDIEKIGEN